jgi:hypothetical protein
MIPQILRAMRKRDSLSRLIRPRFYRPRNMSLCLGAEEFKTAYHICQKSKVAPSQ